MTWFRTRTALVSAVFGVLVSEGFAYAESTGETSTPPSQHEELVVEAPSPHQCYQHPLFRKRHSKKKRPGTAPVATAQPTPQHLTSVSK